MNGKELVFRKPGEEGESEGDEEEEDANPDTSFAPMPIGEEQAISPVAEALQVVEPTRIVIHEN